jgi:hypothetical protein
MTCSRTITADPFQVLVDLSLSNGTDVGFIAWDALMDSVAGGEPNIAKVGGGLGALQSW